jgi:glycosyltransferase involved in cell wall biosynthesis
VHVIAGLGDADGGPAYTVPRLCKALSQVGVRTTLLSVAAEGESARDTRDAGYHDRRFARQHGRVPIARDLRLSSGLCRALSDQAIEADVLHNHGLWLMPNVHAGRVAARTNTPLVIAPRGMLSTPALAFSRKKKAAFWWALQGPAIRHAACFHATSYQEYEDIRAFGVAKPVALIPNGIDLFEQQRKRVGTIEADRVMLSLGRIHPKKGLDRLVRAWAKVEAAFPEWRLKIVGPAELGHDVELRALAEELKLNRISIELPVYGENKRAVFEGADVFVLSSLNENFAMTVAESLAAGTPVISTKGAPWRGLEIERCGWWIEPGVESLAAALARAMALPREELAEMGARGRAWMARDFGWETAAEKTRAVYLWLAGRSPRPEHVITD